MTSIPVSYQVNGGTATAKTFEGNLAKGETAEFSLGTVDVTTLGTYEIKAFTQLENEAIRQMTPSYSHYRIMPMYTYMATDGMLTAMPEL